MSDNRDHLVGQLTNDDDDEVINQGHKDGTSENLNLSLGHCWLLCRSKNIFLQQQKSYDCKINSLQ